MDFRKQYLKEYIVDTLKYAFNGKAFWQAVTKPWKIPVALYKIYKISKAIVNDVKLKPVSIEDTLHVVNASVLALAELSSKHFQVLPARKTLDDLYRRYSPSPEDSEELGHLFRTYGSDKSTVHDYHLAYASILAKKKNMPVNILEIGLGTNNIDVMSNMGISGQPGASLRAFRDMYRKASIVGADVDVRVLFSEDRIKTYFVDQTKPETFDELRKKLGDLTFDLVIDDGLHNSQANLNTVCFALDILKPDGVLVIEDVAASDLKYYQIVAAILKGSYSVEFVETKNGSICVFSRLPRAG